VFHKVLIAGSLAVALAGCSPTTGSNTPTDGNPSNQKNAQISHTSDSCCVPASESVARQALVSQIVALSNDVDDADPVRENANIVDRIRPELEISELEDILVHERLAIDRHGRREMCEGSTASECKNTMDAIYAEDYAYGFCFTMTNPQDCILTAARNAAYPETPIKNPNEREATALAARAYQK